ncbi:16S rRNA (cytosine(1402)-N(4))-methyltransferase RsmH [Anaerovibrio lipolyticus]|uniref:16S rRNA (cytosine(1402)-N(4))-methyltransferase RsmH n=1 Tax=Anaerovibrio lipolyticus TaxID=82374 RepID=UPI0026EF76C5|nr:16S rRNA (cytosine(1402)-N(4))-methyltransferase RsmH [Anaerovibrio lipolyticus]MBE6106976.1 16S rRNA (cytosine(1402)-N(4))-methyltransferase RsmH [Anaerovibrio lipolyticus]MBE6106982.1 16S rRNA (cytosine(1402)-N(4))-methyltransferase RsmH [Anaerovibrio lipolyticus]
MSEKFHHVSVMPEETVNGLVTNLSGTYVDCTLGGAGHSRMIADKLNEDGRLIGIDQDMAAIAAATERLTGVKCHVNIVKENFSNLEKILREQDAEEIDGILFDLGVSSHQLDIAERGFSYMQDAPLDMRMNQQAEFSAYDIINKYDLDELCRIFKEYGEERWYKRIAQFIVEARKTVPIKTTGELVDIIKKAVPAAVRNAKRGHPAKRIFQAVRIEVNNELGILEEAFRTAVKHLKPGGRIAIITFHSLEDRIAKNVLKEMSSRCICPPSLPVCVCNHKPEIKLLVKAAVASDNELEQNSRAKSAKLRIAEKLD